MPRYDLLAGLDIGASKIRLALARGCVQRRRLEMLGCYTVLSAGFREGSVADLAKAADAVAAVLEQAQDASGQKISSAFVNIMAKHITAECGRGRVNVLYKENEVSRRDLDTACRIAKASAVTYDREPILVAPQNYIVDGESGIPNPVGLQGTRFEADYYIVTGSAPAIGNLRKAVNMAGLEVEEIVLSNLASSFSATSPMEKDIGVVLVDIGAEVTEVSVFSKGMLRYDKMLAMGARQIISAVRDGLKVDAAAAEGILKNYCRLDVAGAAGADEKILIKNTEPAKTLTLKQVEKIAEPAIKELLLAINNALEGAEYAKTAACGIVLLGGVSKIDGMAEMAERIFNMPVKVGLPRIMDASCADSSFASVAPPEASYVTAIGLVTYGLDRLIQRRTGSQFAGSAFKRAVIAARDFVYDYF